MNPYAARMKAMLIFAFFPLLVPLAQPLGTISPWFPVIMIGIGGAAHQSWSANIFSTVGDMFPKSAIATVTGIGGMAGGVGSMILQKRGRESVCLCRCYSDDIYGLHWQACRLFHYLLRMCRRLFDRLDYHEDFGPEI